LGWVAEPCVAWVGCGGVLDGGAAAGSWVGLSGAGSWACCEATGRAIVCALDRGVRRDIWGGGA